MVQESDIILLNWTNFDTIPIRTAVLNKNYEAVKTLINNLFIILNGISEKDKNTLLHDAIEVADFEIFQLLLENNRTTPYEHQKININEKNNNFLSPLLLATKKWHLNFIKRLLEEDIDIYTTDDYEKNILDYLEELDDNNPLKEEIKKEISSRMLESYT